jgi:DNA-binding MarR family transcriptional regulator
MALQTKPVNRRVKHSEANTRKPSASASGIDEGPRDLIWDIFAISSHLAEVRRVWATMLGVSGPQWLILMAVDYLDERNGVSVGTVSAKLHVNQTFIVAQSKTLEASGYLTRRNSAKDARVVLMSLTEQTRRKLTAIAPRRRELNDFVFSQIDKASMKTLSEAMSLIRTKLERAVILLAER